MKKLISVAAVASLFAAGTAMASGYRIPEQSLDSTSKAGANIASADKADATYYNPAGMAWLDDAWQIEGTATYLHLTSIDYDDARTAAFNGSTEKEHFLLPTFFVVSPDYNHFRFGLSLTEPFGLSKRWESGYPRVFAEKFSLKVFELNPTLSYQFGDMVSVGAGVRMLYSEATVMSNSADVSPGLARWVNGDTTEWGYNLAVDVKPNDSWNFAVTYRSNVDLDFDGDVQLLGFPFATKGEVSVPAPAVLAFSAAYNVDRWTFDLTVDQTYWSEYEELDFNYPPFDLTATPLAPFDVAVPKDWDDTVAIRLGVEYAMDQNVTLMAGIAYDENPVPEQNLGFELPDSDAWLFSVGARYKYSEKLEFGLGMLYDYKEERDVVNSNIVGEFSNASAFLVSMGISYKF